MVYMVQMFEVNVTMLSFEMLMNGIHVVTNSFYGITK